jgi:hypothetical protein
MMPTVVDEVFQPLRNEVLDIHLAWRLFRQTFATSKERVVLLNRYAEVWFGYAQAAMYDDIVVSLFRLLDPAKQGTGRENLTLARLADVVMADGQLELAPSIRFARSRVDALLQPFADWRNKRVAHNDLPRMQARWQGNPRTPGPSYATIDEALARVRECLNIVDQHYNDATTAYEAVTLFPGLDGDALIRHLECYEQQRELARAQAPIRELRDRWPDLPPDVQQALRSFYGQLLPESRTDVAGLPRK